MDENSNLLADNMVTTDEGSGSEDKVKPFTDRNAKELELEQQLRRAGFGFFHVVLLMVSGLSTAADSVEIFGVSFVVPIADRDLGLNSADKGWLDAIVFIGMMVGGYLWGSLADVLGRRTVLIIAMLLNATFAFVSAFSPNFYVFLVFRFASGIGVGGAQPVVFSYVSEFFTERQRGPIVIILASCWQPGIIFTALLAWVLMGLPETNTAIDFYIGSLHFVNWRLFLIICALPSFLSSVSFIFLPESPAFLYLMKRQSSLQKVLRKVRNVNSRCPCCWTQKDSQAESPLLSTEEEEENQKGPEHTDAATADGSGHTDSMIVTPSRARRCLGVVISKASKVLEATLGLFRFTYLRATLLLLVIWFSQSYGLVCMEPRSQAVSPSVTLDSIRDLWIKGHICGPESGVGDGLGMRYYGLQLWFPEFFKRLERNCLTNGTLLANCSNDTNLQFYQDALYTALASLPGNIAGALLINIIGGRVQLVGALVLSALSMFSIWRVPNTHGVVLGVSCVFSAITVTVFGSLDVVVMNTYGTSLRSTAFGVHSGIGRIGAVLGNVTFGNLIDSDRTLPILLVASLLAIAAIAAIFLPAIYRPENRPPLHRAVAFLYNRCFKKQQKSYDEIAKENQVYDDRSFSITITSFIEDREQYDEKPTTL